LAKAFTMSSYEVIEFPDGYGFSLPSSLLWSQPMMSEPFKITWQEPKEGTLPAGSKVHRDTGLVGELVTSGFVSKCGDRWLLSGDWDSAARVEVDAGGERHMVIAWVIDGVGLRDDGLLWDLPTKECALPSGMQMQLRGGDLAVVPEGGADYCPSMEWNVKPRQHGPVSAFSAAALGFPRPFSQALYEHPRCDYCGDELSPSTPFQVCSRVVGGVRFTCCSGHGQGDLEFLAGALRLREAESDAALRERWRNKIRYPEPAEPLSAPVDTAALKAQAERVEREAKREQKRLAKISQLADMLRKPMAPRFQPEEPAWRKR
jgi:hypothetical protein